MHALDQTQSVQEGHCRKSQTATVTPAKPGDYPFYLRVTPGETLALTGQNGVGKNSLIHLLMRLYEPEDKS